MGSSPIEGAGPRGPALLGRGLLDDPYLWALVAALAVGVGLALLFRFLGSRRRGEERRAARLSAWALAFLSLGLLAAAALAIFPPKESLASSALPASCLAFLAIGLGSGFFPRACGLPLLFLLLAGAGLLLTALGTWIPLEGPVELASFVPFSVEPASCRGELELTSAQEGARNFKLEFGFAEAGLAVERLELDGPLRLLAGASFYRVRGLVGPRGETAALGSAAISPRLFDLLVPLGGGAQAEASLPLLRLRRETSPVQPLQALAPVRYAFRSDAEGRLVLSSLGSPFMGD